MPLKVIGLPPPLVLLGEEKKVVVCSLESSAFPDRSMFEEPFEFRGVEFEQDAWLSSAGSVVVSSSSRLFSGSSVTEDRSDGCGDVVPSKKPLAASDGTGDGD